MSGKIEPGTEVVWDSQSSGYVSTKVGVVLAHLPPWTSARPYLPESFSNGQLRFDAMKSSTSRYLIRVDRKSKDDKPLSPYFYTPLASVIDRFNSEVTVGKEEA